MDESVAVRQLLAFAKAEFGEHLCALLLAGYGEGEARRRRAFVVTTRAGGGRERRVIFVSDDPSGLPRGYDPLVLLALLRSLWLSGPAGTTVVSYTPPSLLRDLGLDDSLRSRAAVGRAVERYYDLSVGAEDVPNAGGGEPQHGLLRLHRLITGYDREEESEGGDGGHDWAEGRVRFNPDFVAHLKARSLLGIDWTLVAAVTQTQ